MTDSCLNIRARPAGPATRRVASQPQAALGLDPAVREVATVVDEVRVAIYDGPDAAQLVDAPDERFRVCRGEPCVLEVEYRHAVREVVARVPVEELGFRHAAVRPHEEVEAPWLSVVYAPLHPRVAVPVNERRTLRGLHDV